METQISQIGRLDFSLSICDICVLICAICGCPARACDMLMPEAGEAWWIA
jgi:hypothetical protein